MMGPWRSNLWKRVSVRFRPLTSGILLAISTGMKNVGVARYCLPVVLATLCLLASSTAARAADTLCDPSAVNCRTQLLTLIQNENVGLDVAFWFMQDTRYSTEIIRRWQAGVPVRVIVDPRANPTYTGNEEILADR